MSDTGLFPMKKKMISCGDVSGKKHRRCFLMAIMLDYFHA